MTATTLINYSTRDFASKEDLELYLERQDAAFSPEVTKLFTDLHISETVNSSP